MAATPTAGGVSVPTVTVTTGLALTVLTPMAANLKVYFTDFLPVFAGTVTSWLVSPLQGVAVYGIPVIVLFELNTQDVALATVADRVMVPPVL
jgi:hypothetical protein